MSFEGRTITVTGLLEMEFPGATVRLCDGGFVDFDGNRFTAKDATFGTVASAEGVEEEIADFAPGGLFSLTPSPDAALADFFGPSFQNSRVRMWMGEVDADDVTVGDAELLFDGFVDTQNWRPKDGTLDFQFISRADKLFLRNEGNVLSSAFHQSIWAGEKGCDNCTDAPVAVAWGTKSPPRGTATVSGGGGGGRQLFNNEKEL